MGLLKSKLKKNWCPKAEAVTSYDFVGVNSSVASNALKALSESSAESERNGLSEMSLEEINAEITATRDKD